jgi:hypothetical protein
VVLCNEMKEVVDLLEKHHGIQHEETVRARSDWCRFWQRV